MADTQEPYPYHAHTATMFLLYTSPICPYCRKVEAVLHERGIPYEERNVVNPTYRDELIEKGGRMQVPFFVDTERDVAMYESDDIIAYVTARAL